MTFFRCLVFRSRMTRVMAQETKKNSSAVSALPITLNPLISFSTAECRCRELSLACLPVSLRFNECKLPERSFLPLKIMVRATHASVSSVFGFRPLLSILIWDFAALSVEVCFQARLVCDSEELYVISPLDVDIQLEVSPIFFLSECLAFLERLF